MARKPGWSYSARKTFEECKRAFYYDKYPYMCPDKSRVYMFKKMTAIPLLAGSAVHSAISRAAEDVRSFGRAPSAEKITERYLDLFDRGARLSREAADSLKYGETAESLLMEHYYGDPEAEDKLAASRQSRLEGLQAFLESELWQKITETGRDGFVEVDRDDLFPSFDLDGITVYAKIDLALGGKNWLRIFDWKTGKADRADLTQLAVYVLYAKYALRRDPARTAVEFVYLDGSTSRDKHNSVDPALLEETEGLIRKSYGEMLRLYNGGNPRLEEHPMNTGAGCSRCRFKELCGMQG
ncbi:MAG: PD-(D/E)XK nuclease family protein [Abditibacteriota bacterium]|nr:PD-(D/E)XK nuclease family protein [Abditibacteriota bacterium]